MPSKLGVLVAAGAVALVAAACDGGAKEPAASGPATQTVQVSVSSCGAGWTEGTAGRQHLVLHNSDSRSADVMLADARSGAVFAEVETIGAGASAPLQVDLGGGTYRIRCLLSDEDAIDGPVVTVTGHVDTVSPSVQPVTRNDLVPVAKAYQAYVIGRLPTLAGQTSALQAAVDYGDLAAARRLWLPAHLTYEGLGAAYDAFGDADAAINGTPDGLPDGVTDKDFQGFHRLEYGLWHGQSAGQLKPVADDLTTAVQRLRTDFPKSQVDLLDISIRAHEITENTARFDLTGRSDFGSGTSLATAQASLKGTEAVLAPLRPLLVPRMPQLAALDAELAKADADLLAQRHPDGTWTALSALAAAGHERLDADFGDLDELLSHVAAIAEPRRVS